MKFKILFFLITFFYFNSSFADVLKPSVNINPKQVVVIQLNALMKNDSPYKDRGIEQTWEFAHPNNQRMTGPLDRFKRMLKGASYSMLIDHKENTVTEIYKSSTMALMKLLSWIRTNNILNLNGKLKRIIKRAIFWIAG